MYTPIAFGIVAFIVSLIMYIRADKYGLVDWIMLGVLGIAATFIAVIAGYAVAFGIGFLVPRQVIHERVSIVTLDDWKGPSGHFFLGTGSFQGKNFFSIYYSINGGIKSLTLQNEDDVTVYQDSTPENSYLAWNYNTCQSGLWDAFIGCFVSKDHYEIHVPVGTIDQHFSLNNS